MYVCMYVCNLFHITFSIIKVEINKDVIKS